MIKTNLNIILKNCFQKLITITIIITFLALFCLFLPLEKGQSAAYADENSTELFANDSIKESTNIDLKSYTRVASTLLIVVALIMGAAFVLKKKYGVRTSLRRSKKYINIIDCTALGGKKTLFIVKVPGKHLLLGVTNDRIGLITEVANEDVVEKSEGVNIDKKEFLNLVKKSIREKNQG